ncbi:MAG: DUF2207 domain-containing protein, partial [Elusimicrobiota bacterium]|nr:DUF2207 domain-containing protein [Elusimicrobiota bacterium]
GAKAIQEKISTYTGPFGSKTTTAVQTGPLSFETTGPLYQGHGLTVAVPWQNGVLQAPTVSLTPYIPAAYAQLLLIILIIYCFITWKKYGKDPTDPVVTEYAPPEDISPALMRTIIRKNPDTKAFATAIISLAMKGKITITQEKSFLSSKTFLNKVDNSPNNVAKEEMPILDRTYGSFELSQANYSLLHTSMDKVREYLNADAEIYIEPNTKHLIIPAAIILLMLLPLLFKAPVLFFATLIYFTVLYFFLSPAVSVKGSGTTGAIISTGIFLALTIEAFFVMSRPSLIYFAMLVPVFVCFVVYSTLIDNYTERGRELINRIKGFKHYMSIAEEGRVALSDPMDAERIFADYLPYAFALDMENKWFKKFEGIISAAVIEKTVARAGGMRFARGSALIGAINAAQPRSSGGGSSGSGGGGFSGGGFGGGGGGGR